MIGSISVAAATAVVDYDLLVNKEWKRSHLNRLLTAVACTGSAAAGDTIVELFLNAEKIAELYNSATGFPTRDHYVPINRLIPGGSEMVMKVKDAPVTNPINVVMIFVP